MSDKYSNGSGDPVAEHIRQIDDTVPSPLAAPPAAKALTLAELDAQIEQAQAAYNQLQGAVAATDVYQAMIRMGGGLEALKAMRVLLTGVP